LITTNNLKSISHRSNVQSALLACALFVSAAVMGIAQATTVTYDVSNVASNTWEYTYTVANDMLAFDIEEITIFFDVGLYENLAAQSTPAGWDVLVIEPDVFLPDDGFYDALSLGVGIVPGVSLGGFSVQFDFLGAGVPGDQFFDIVDPFTFDVLDSGSTSVIPIPAAIWLFISGLISFSGVGAFRRRTVV